MPYVQSEYREDFDDAILDIVDRMSMLPQTGVKGALNYVISRIVAASVHQSGPTQPWRYNEIADAVATFECAKLEFYRRIAGPKEDEAVAVNGDIPEYAG